jgi:hypothetical protein
MKKLVLILAVSFLSGCAAFGPSSIDKHAAMCFGTGGKPSYIDSDGFKRFDCNERGGNASAGR